MFFTKAGWIATAYDSLTKGAKIDVTDSSEGELPDEDEQTAGELTVGFSDVHEMLNAAQNAKELAKTYLDHKLDDGSQVRFSMLLALIEKKASLRLWSKEGYQEADCFGWGIDDPAVVSKMQEELDPDLPEEPWVVHARYIHSVIDTAVRLQLRYGRVTGKPIVGIIIGDTPNSERNEIKDRFSKGDLNIVCMSDAGAEGINLQKSSRIVLLDVPVSPGRIEQIAGRVHRLGSTKAVEVTLLLPPNTLGSRVFNALRRAARQVYRQAHDMLPVQPSADKKDKEQLYILQLAESEARLLTVVADMTGTMRSPNNRDKVAALLDESKDGGQGCEPVEKLMQSGYDLALKQKKERFVGGSNSKPSDMLPKIDDLVDALRVYKSATTTKSTATFHVPVRLIKDLENFGDLEMKDEPFDLLHVDGKTHCYASRRFLPTDLLPDGVDAWLGVSGNAEIRAILKGWRESNPDLSDEDRWKPHVWTTNALPRGRVIAFCGVANVFRSDGEGAASSEQTVHVTIGFGGVGQPFVWRPFFARGQGTAWDLVRSGTSFEEILPTISQERWAAKLIRHLTGLEGGITCSPCEMGSFEECAQRAREDLVVESVDPEDKSKTWRLRMGFKDWLVANGQSTWWDGGDKRDCRPRFLLLALGE